MGGYSSGRRDGGPLVEDGWKLDLAHCMRTGMILPGRHVSGSMRWTSIRTGEVTCSVEYRGQSDQPCRSVGPALLHQHGPQHWR